MTALWVSATVRVISWYTECNSTPTGCPDLCPGVWVLTEGNFRLRMRLSNCMVLPHTPRPRHHMQHHTLKFSLMKYWVTAMCHAKREERTMRNGECGCAWRHATCFPHSLHFHILKLWTLFVLGKCFTLSYIPGQLVQINTAIHCGVMGLSSCPDRSPGDMFCNGCYSDPQRKSERTSNRACGGGGWGPVTLMV